MPQNTPTLSLPGGVQMPMIALGTWPMDNEQTAAAVESALHAGYRHIDTAENYGNESGVGEGLRRAGLPRDQVFITTKFNKQWHSAQGARQAFDAACSRLGVDYLDLFMIHWPNPGQDTYADAFKGLKALHGEGLIRAIGTSNFKPSHLRRLIDYGLLPAVNQIQLDPLHTRKAERSFHQERGIATSAYSPLGRDGTLLQDATVEKIARVHGKTPSQIVLRWHIQQGIAATPKSADPRRQRENLDILDFELDPDQIARVSALDSGEPVRLDSDEFGH